MTTETTATLDSITVLNYVIERQNAGKNTSVGQIAKKFAITADQVAEHLSGFEGYTVKFSDELIGTKTTVTVYADEASESEEEAEVGETEEPAAEAEAEPVVADAPKPARSRKAYSDVYPNFGTAEEASAAHPGGYISVADVNKTFMREGAKVSRMVKAIGGDHMTTPPLNDLWTPFTIAGKSKRYLPNEVVNDIPTFKDDEAWKALWKTDEPAVAEEAATETVNESV